MKSSSGLYVLFRPLPFQSGLLPLDKLGRRIASDLRWLNPPEGHVFDDQNILSEVLYSTDTNEEDEEVREWKLKLEAVNNQKWRLVTIGDDDWARWRVFEVGCYPNRYPLAVRSHWQV